MSKISELSDGGSLVSSDYLIAVRSGGNVKVRMDQINVDQVDLGDNEFIRLGNSQDLTMVHTSTQSIINQAGIGDLLIQKAGATKLTINSSGIDVTGSVTADGLVVDGTTSVTQSSNAATALTSFTNSNAGTSSRTSISFTSDTGSSVVGTVSSTWNIDALNANETFLYGSHGVSLFAPASQNIRFLAGGSEKVRITSAGNVGIGGNGVGNGLGVYLNRGAITNFYEASDGTKTMIAGTDAGNDFVKIGSLSAHPVGFVVGNGERMRLDASGNLLVGKTAASFGTAGVAVFGSGEIDITNTNEAPLFLNRLGSDGAIQYFYKYGTTVGNIGTQGGDLNIGTAACGIAFVDGVPAIYPWTTTGNTTRDAAIDLGDSGARFKDLYLSGNAHADNFVGTNDTDTFVSMAGSNIMRFYTGGAEAARLDASGNLLVNDTGVSGNAEKFRITSGGTSTATSAALFNNSAGTELFFVRSDGAFRTGTAAISPYNNTAAVTANLFVNTDGTLVRATSSRKYKKDIIDARFGLSDLLNLRPVNYKGINSEVDEDTIYGGLIAEEVHEAGLTEFVEYNKENQPDALRYQHMVSLCIKAIQEQQATIEALTARIAALES